MLIATLLSIFTSTTIAGGSHDHKHRDDANLKRVETAFGTNDPNMQPTRVIDVVMSDNMRFSPGLIKVKKGDLFTIGEGKSDIKTNFTPSFQKINLKSSVKIDDGKLSFSVCKKNSQKQLQIKALNDGIIKNGKGIKMLHTQDINQELLIH